MKEKILFVCVALLSFNTFGQDLKTVINKYFESVGGKEIVESIKTSSFRYRFTNYYPNNDTTYIDSKQKAPNHEISLTYDNRGKLVSQTVLYKDSLHLFLTKPYSMKFSTLVNQSVFIDPSTEILSLYNARSLKYSKPDSLNGNLYEVLVTNHPETKRPNKAFFFDNQTGLLIATKANNTTFYGDYRIVKGLKYSFLREHYLNQTLLDRVIYESVELNVDLTINDFKSQEFEPPPLRKTDSEYNKIHFVDAEYSDRSIQDLIKSFQGKRLLIDIWATWCGPCKIEFTKYNDDLYGFLADKNINLLFISIDKPEKDKIWKKDVLWFNVNGYHLRANKNLSNSISKEISGGNSYFIPRYILINEQGKILSNNLTKPSSPDFRDVVNRLLN